MYGQHGRKGPTGGRARGERGGCTVRSISTPRVTTTRAGIDPRLSSLIGEKRVASPPPPKPGRQPARQPAGRATVERALSSGSFSRPLFRRCALPFLEQKLSGEVEENARVLLRGERSGHARRAPAGRAGRARTMVTGVYRDPRRRGSGKGKRERPRDRRRRRADGSQHERRGKLLACVGRNGSRITPRRPRRWLAG